jgi:hypothetical protein
MEFSARPHDNPRPGSGLHLMDVSALHDTLWRLLQQEECIPWPNLWWSDLTIQMMQIVS